MVEENDNISEPNESLTGMIDQCRRDSCIIGTYHVRGFEAADQQKVNNEILEGAVRWAHV